MRLAHYVIGAGALISWTVFAHAQLEERAAGEECEEDQDCISGCCGARVSPKLCLDALTQGPGEACNTYDGCDCEVGRCDMGFCPKGTPSPASTSEVCEGDIDCYSGCCASLLDPMVCIEKATKTALEACVTEDGCDCFYGMCIDGICAGNDLDNTIGPVLGGIDECEDNDHCPNDTECCGDGRCHGDISECEPPRTSPTPTPAATAPPTTSPTPPPTSTSASSTTPPPTTHSTELPASPLTAPLTTSPTAPPVSTEPPAVAPTSPSISPPSWSPIPSPTSPPTTSPAAPLTAPPTTTLTATPAPISPPIALPTQPPTSTPVRLPMPPPASPPTKMAASPLTAPPATSPTETPAGTTMSTTSPTPLLESTLTKPPTPTLLPSLTPARTELAMPAPSSSATPPLWSIVAASAIGGVLLGVLALTCVRLKKHCAARGQSIRQSLQVLMGKGSFWAAMAVLLGLFVTLNVFDSASMWGIVKVWAAFVLWVIVLAWFVAFKSGTTVSVPVIP